MSLVLHGSNAMQVRKPGSGDVDQVIVVPAACPSSAGRNNLGAVFLDDLISRSEEIPPRSRNRKMVAASLIVLGDHYMLCFVNDGSQRQPCEGLRVLGRSKHGCVQRNLDR